MRILIVDSYYAAFLDSFFARRPDLTGCAYDEQWHILMEQCFGTADFYSTNLIALGHEAAEIVANCEPLQRQWARENGIKLSKTIWTNRGRILPWRRHAPIGEWLHKIVVSQVEQYRPDVLHIQDMNGTSSEFLREVRPYVRIITGQIACPMSARANFREYDLVLSSFPHFVERFRKQGLRSEYFNLGFEPRLLQRLEAGERWRVVFVGGLSADHAERIAFLERIAAVQPIDIWGYGIESLDDDSVLRRDHHGELWALDMYQVLHNADIALNHHINEAGDYANNMRLYEATGVGTLLLTDYKTNLNSLFEVGKEVATYRSPEEALALIRYYLDHADERRAIARAGQARTLQEHTYRHRMEQFVDIVSAYL